MNRKKRQELTAAKNKYVEASARAILEGNIQDAEESMKAVGSIDKVLVNSERSNFIFPLVIGLVCTIIVGLAATIKVPTTFVRISMDTDFVSFEMLSDYKPDDGKIQVAEVTMMNLGGVSSIYTDQELERKELHKIDIREGGPIEFHLKQIGKNSRVELNKRAANYEIWNLKQGVSLIEIQADSAIFEMEFDEKYINDTIDVPIPESFNISTRDSTNLPTQIEFFRPSDISLVNLQGDNLSFAKEDPPGSSNFISGIRSGKIQLFDQKYVHEVTQGDFVKLKDFQGKRLEIRSKEDQYQVILEGKVSQLKAGPEGHLEEFKPSWLEYMFNQQFIGFLWSAMVFVWGFIWSVHRLFSK